MQRCSLAWLFLFGLSACPQADEKKQEDGSAPASGPATASQLHEAAERADGLRELPLPVAPGSSSANVHVDATGRLHLVWLEPSGHDGHALRLASHDGDGWSEANSVTQGPFVLANWADVPVLSTFDDGTVVLAWPESHEDEEGYGFQLTRSQDRGLSFPNPISLQGDAQGTEFGFVSFARKNAEELEVFWLDGRQMKQGGMQLRRATLPRRGPLKNESILDYKTCECCQTGATSNELGQLVVYRDRAAGEIRDVRIAGAKLPSEGSPLHPDGWKIDGCPVNGPAIASTPYELAVAWFSGHAPPGEVKVAFSGDPKQFGNPIRVDGGKPVGRVDVEMTAQGAALVTWLEYAADDADLAEIRVRSVFKDGRMGAPRLVAKTASSKESGFPRSVLRDDKMIWVWTDPGQQGMSRVRAAEAPIKSLL
jgi:hypothetical protein